MKNKKGLSLIEVILSMSILLIVLQVVYSLFFVGQNSFAVSNNKGFAQQGVRIANTFLTNELKYANSFISNDDFNAGLINTTIYGIQFDNNKLLRKKFIYNESTAEYDMTIEKGISGEWNNILIRNNEFGKLNVYIIQEENSLNLSSNFELDFAIELINDPLLKSDMEWNLKDGDIIYYTISSDVKVGSIKLNNDGNNDGNNGGESVGESGTIHIESYKVYRDKNNNKEEIFQTDGKYHLQNDPYKIVIKYFYNGTKKLTITNDSIAITPIDNEIVIYGSYKSFTHKIIIKESESNYKELNITIDK